MALTQIPSGMIAPAQTLTLNGVTFPATQVPSADANTLDDYEEGTFTATLIGATTSPTTPITSTATYTKVGRIVTVSINFNNVNTTGASGSLVITGLPFSCDGAFAQVGTPPMTWNVAISQKYNIWYVTANTLNLYGQGNNTTWSAEAITATSPVYIWTSVTYTTAG